MKAKYYLQLEVRDLQTRVFVVETLRRSLTFLSFFQNLKKNVDERQAKLSQAKGEYKSALRNLEMISDEIHERRRSSAMGPRGRGVGAEGDSVSGDDASSFKMESDGISSECTNLCLSIG